VVRGVGQLFTFGDAEMLSECLVVESKGNSGIDNTAMRVKLNQFFSDGAAKEHFWNLSFVNNLISDKE